MKNLFLFVLLLFSAITSAQLSFEEYNASTFTAMYGGNTIFLDLHSDDDLDLIMAGFSENGSVWEIYQNNDGIFSPIAENPIDLEGCCQEATSIDVDSDGDKDLIVSRAFFLNDLEPVTMLYRNVNGSLEADAEFVLPYYSSRIITEDMNGDGSADILLVELTEEFEEITRKFFNDGNGLFTEVSEDVIDEDWYTSDVADIDGDGDIDLATFGNDENELRFYENDGFGNFSLVEMDFEGFYLGDLVFFDSDNDGDNDLIISGLIGNWEHVTKFYENEGNWTFSEVPDDVFRDLSQGKVEAVDIDADGDLDIFLTGVTNTPKDITPIFSSNLYINNGGVFTELPNQPFEDVNQGPISFGDVNNDGDLDIFLTGNTQVPAVAYSKLYINNGLGLSLNEDEYYEEIRVFPNPVKGRIHFEISSGDLINSYRILSLEGKIITDEKIRIPSSMIQETINLQDGMYILEIETESKSTFTSRLVVRN